MSKRRSKETEVLEEAEGLAKWNEVPENAAIVVIDEPEPGTADLALPASGELRTYEEFEDRIIELVRADSYSKMEIGWTLNDAENALGEQYSQLLAALDWAGRPYGTTASIKWTALHTPREEYDVRLSFSHYKVLAGQGKDRLKWQKKSLKFGWSVAALTEQIEKTKKPADAEEAAEAVAAGLGLSDAPEPNAQEMSIREFISAQLQNRFSAFHGKGDLADDVSRAMLASYQEWHDARGIVISQQTVTTMDQVYADAPETMDLIEYAEPEPAMADEMDRELVEAGY